MYYSRHDRINQLKLHEIFLEYAARGFNEEKLRSFLPRKMRVFQLYEVHSFIEEAQ
jgi:hypothetical protein